MLSNNLGKRSFTTQANPEHKNDSNTDFFHMDNSHSHIEFSQISPSYENPK